MKGNFLMKPLDNKLLAVAICGVSVLFAISYIFEINLTGLVFSINFTGIAAIILNGAEFVLICVWILVGIRLIHYLETLTNAAQAGT